MPTKPATAAAKRPGNAAKRAAAAPKSKPSADPTSSAPPAVGEPFDWFHVAVCADLYRDTGDVAPLAEAFTGSDSIDPCPEPPEAVRLLIADAFVARLRRHGKPGRPQSVVNDENAALCCAIAAAYRRELRAQQRAQQAAPASTPRERAADAVARQEPFCRFDLTRSAVLEAVTVAARSARENPHPNFAHRSP